MNNSIEEFLEVMQKDITVTTIEENGARMLIPAKVNKISTNIIVNGFNMKDIILDVFRDYTKIDFCRCEEEIAELIKEAFAIKLGLKQG